MTKKMSTQSLNFKWCIDNDFQVYIKPDKYFKESNTVSKQYRICIRRGGITTCGLDEIEINSVIYTSRESVGNILYKTQKEAEEALPKVYEELRKRYD